MKLNEETFLTAYLDGELDPGPRSRVEAVVMSDPEVAEDLRDLTAVRDLVAGLVRPSAPVDVSGSVVAAIRLRHDAGPLGRVIGVTAASWSGRAVALVSAAAALVAAASLNFRDVTPDPVARPIASRDGSSRPLPVPASVPGTSTVPIPVAVTAEAGRPAPGRDEGASEREQQQVRALLDSPNLRKILIVTDVIGGDAGRQVGDLIEKTPRRNASYGRFTVSQGIIIDPDHPGEATVFAVVMDDHELGQLRTRLDQWFPNSVQEAETRPEVVTNLAEVGQVSVFPGVGSNVAVLIDPSERSNVALQAQPNAHRNPMEFQLVPEFTGVDPLHDAGGHGFFAGPVPESDRSASGTRAPALPPERRRNRTDASVVLVWVSSNRRDGPGAR